MRHIRNWMLAGLMLFVAAAAPAAFVDFSNTDISGDAGHNGQDYSVPAPGPYSNFTNTTALFTDFTGTDFTNGIFTGAIFDDANLTNVDLTGADLVGARFLRATISGADFTNALINGTFDAVSATNGADLRITALTATQLKQTSSYGDVSTGYDGNLQEVNFGRIDVSVGTNGFANGDFHNMDLRGANFQSNFDADTLTGQTFDGSNLDGALFASDSANPRQQVLDPEALINADSMVGITIQDVDLTAMNPNTFKGKDLSGADFQGSDLTGVDLTDSILAGVVFADLVSGSHLPAEMDGAIIEGTELAPDLPLVWDERLTRQVERHAYSVMGENADALAYEPGMGVREMLASAASDADAIAMSLGGEMAAVAPADEATRLAEGTLERRAPSTVRPSTRPKNLGTATIWAMPYGLMADHKDAHDRWGYETCGFGIAGGVDVKITNDFLVGLAFSYEHKNIDFSHSRGQGDMDSYRFGPYLSLREGPAFLTASVNLGLHTSDYSRTILVNQGGKNDGAYSMWDITASATVGYDMELAPGTTFTPMATVTYSYIRREQFQEKGPALTAVDFDAVSECALSTRLGARLSHKGEILGLPANLQLEAGWAHEYMFTHASISGTGGMGGKFDSNTDTTAPDIFYYGMGLGVRLNDTTSMSFRYQGQMASDMVEHLGSISFVFQY